MKPALLRPLAAKASSSNNIFKHPERAWSRGIDVHVLQYHLKLYSTRYEFPAVAAPAPAPPSSMNMMIRRRKTNSNNNIISSSSSSSTISTTCRSSGSSALQTTEILCQRERGHQTAERMRALEEGIEKVIYGFRFMTFLGVWGSLFGSLLCFLKGCIYVVGAFMEYWMSGGKVILMLVEAIDIYLLGTVMLVFGMGLYELFISNLDIAQTHKLSHATGTVSYRSNLFGLFTLMERPRWLEIKSLNELKTKLGHVIVMILLVGLFEKSKKVVICSSTDLLCFSAVVLLSSGGLYLLSKLNNDKRNKQA